MEDILEQQLLIRGRAFATVSAIEKALAGRKKSFRRPVCCAGQLFFIYLRFQPFASRASHNCGSDIFGSARKLQNPFGLFTKN